jgi:hypothetical protein
LAASSTPVSASSVTVAACPTLTLLMSDSSNATVIDSVCRLTISANSDVVEEVVDAVLLVPRLLLLVPLESELEVSDDAELESLPDETGSPGERLSRVSIVPTTGARSRVCARAVSSVFTVCSSVSIVASSESMVPAVVVVVLPEPLDADDPEEELALPLEDPADVVVGVAALAVVAGVVTVVVGSAEVVVVAVAVVGVVMVVAAVVVAAAVLAGVESTYSVCSVASAAVDVDSEVSSETSVARAVASVALASSSVRAADAR